MKFEAMPYPEAERDFLLDACSGKNVFEWGTGAGTLKIRDVALNVWSVEHDSAWYSEFVKVAGPENMKLIEPNEAHDGISDGSFSQFRSYACAPITWNPGKIDVFYIDGRARLSCAMVASLYGKTTIVHDWEIPPHPTRKEYLNMTKFLSVESICGKLIKFKPGW